MASSVLMVYVPLEELKDKKDYWTSYTKFYERYWGGPTSPFGVWFGNEYNTYRKMLSEHLGIEENEIEDCYFMKDDDRYLICPLVQEMNPYLITAENFIPLEWFLPFVNDDRKYLMARWGFGSIYYHTAVSQGLERLEKAQAVIGSFIDKSSEAEAKDLYTKMLDLRRRVTEGEKWLSQYNPSGFVLLNYGEIASIIHPYTLKDELSVKELWDVLDKIEAGDYENARTLLNVLIQKWDEIRIQASGETEKPIIQ